jgi:hypothetical protein
VIGAAAWGQSRAVSELNYQKSRRTISSWSSWSSWCLLRADVSSDSSSEVPAPPVSATRKSIQAWWWSLGRRCAMRCHSARE